MDKKPILVKEKPKLFIRDPKTWHIALAEHAGHDIEIEHFKNHTHIWCNDCPPNKIGRTQKYLIFKTYESGEMPVGFPAGY